MRIDANKLHEKARHSRKNQVESEDLSSRPQPPDGAGANAPQDIANQQRAHKFVYWRRVDSLRRRYQPIRKTHSPRKRSWSAVISVSRNQTANAANAVPDSGGGGGDIQHQQNLHFVVPRQ